MKSPLQADKDLMNEFEIDQLVDVDDDVKIGYVRSQIDEFKKVIYRNRVDALISQDLIERAEKTKDEAMAQKGRENLTNYRNVIRQMVSAAKMMEQLKDELEATVETSSNPTE